MFTGCSKDNDYSDPGDKVVESIPTATTFSFNIGNGGSGPHPPTANDISEGAVGNEGHDKDIKDVRLIIFKTGTSSVCEVNEMMKVGDTNWDAKMSKTVSVTSGTKRIFVIANTEDATKTKAILTGYFFF